MKKLGIYFQDLTIDGKHQKEWFKIFDLLDKIFPVEVKKEMVLSYERCFITNFNFTDKNYPKGTTRRKLYELVVGKDENKVCEFDCKTGKIKWFKKRGEIYEKTKHNTGRYRRRRCAHAICDDPLV